MNQETNDFLTENLNDAHSIFNHIILEMKDKKISFPYKTVIEKETNSYEIICKRLAKMRHNLHEYNCLVKNNNDLFHNKSGIYMKYISLYVLSIVFIKVFHEIFTTEKFDDYWHYLVGLFLGSAFMFLQEKDLNDYKSDTKEKRDIINRVKTLKEEYKECHDQAVIEINYIFALNDNLWDELDNDKNLVKK